MGAASTRSPNIASKKKHNKELAGKPARKPRWKPIPWMTHASAPDEADVDKTSNRTPPVQPGRATPLAAHEKGQQQQRQRQQQQQQQRRRQQQQRQQQQQQQQPNQRQNNDD